MMPGACVLPTAEWRHLHHAGHRKLTEISDMDSDKSLHMHVEDSLEATATAGPHGVVHIDAEHVVLRARDARR